MYRAQRDLLNGSLAAKQLRSLEVNIDTMKRISKIKGFTLAEVLITLAIIGVVAAVTMPMLIQNYKKHEVITKLIRFDSMISQAIKLSENDNGSALSWSKPEKILDDEGDFDYSENGRAIKVFFYKYIAPYLKYTKVEDAENTVDDEGNKSGTLLAVYLADGSKFYMHNGDCIDFNYDVNANKAPNSVGRDIFQWTLCLSEQQRNQLFGNKNKVFGPIYYPNYFATRDARVNACANDGFWCLSLIYMDGWQIKKDYPLKF